MKISWLPILFFITVAIAALVPLFKNHETSIRPGKDIIPHNSQPPTGLSQRSAQPIENAASPQNELLSGVNTHQNVKTTSQADIHQIATGQSATRHLSSAVPPSPSSVNTTSKRDSSALQPKTSAESVSPVAPATATIHVLQSPDGLETTLTLSVDEGAQIPFAAAAFDPALPAPVREAGEEIANRFVDAVAESAGLAENQGSSTSQMIPPAAWQDAQWLADQQFKTLYGTAAYMSAGMQAALKRMEMTTAQPGDDARTGTPDPMGL